MSKNSFKELEDLEIEKVDASLEQIKSNVNHNLDIFQYVGEIAQHFIPKILQLFLSFLGGDSDRKADPNSKYPNLRG